jgi:hypothetical protein
MNADVREMAAQTISVIMLIIVSFFVGVACATFCERNAAMEAGAGGWVVNAATGETRFIYGKGTAK